MSERRGPLSLTKQEHVQKNSSVGTMRQQLDGYGGEKILVSNARSKDLESLVSV